MKDYIGRYINVVMKKELTFDELISKYGVKIWNGDKIVGQLLEEKEDYFAVVGEQAGTMETIFKVVKIDKNDIQCIICNRGTRKSMLKPIWGCL